MRPRSGSDWTADAAPATEIPSPTRSDSDSNYRSTVRLRVRVELRVACTGPPPVPPAVAPARRGVELELEGPPPSLEVYYVP